MPTLYRLKNKFTNKRPIFDADGNQATKPVNGKDEPQFEDVELTVPDDWSHWVVTESGEHRRMGLGDACTLREDFVKSLGDQIEKVPGGKPAPAPLAPAP